MKPAYLIVILLLLALPGVAQNWDSYLISVKGDTINCLDKKKMKQGKWVIRTEALRGEPGYEEEGEFYDDKKEGPWRRYNLTGDLLSIESYRWGFKDGKQMYFTPLGDLMREEAWHAVNPENPYDTIEVPDLSNPMVTMTKIVKQEVSELKHGTWKYYDPSTGRITKTESFSYGMKLDAMGKPINDSSGNKTLKTSEASQPAKKPTAVEEWEKKQSGKKSIKVRDGRTSGGG
jgi:antitoxin component YwqK of YwqJK toxin-antitoxin module